MTKQKIRHLFDGDLENYKCKCGNEDFSVMVEDIDSELGTTEMIFACECGAMYEWTYGEVGELK